MAFLVHAAICSHAQQKEKPFRLHYFYNSGWLVETRDHLLVFDFVPGNNNEINWKDLQQEIIRRRGAKKLFIFITHDHNDHFNEDIFHLQDLDVNGYILGWKYSNPASIPGLQILTPGDSLIQPSFSVYTHPATDDGSAFLVNIDGLSIYHAGDHALWVEELMDEFTKQLYLIKQKTRSIDLAFVPAARGLFTNCATDSIINKGVKLTAAILAPSTIALQHIGCKDKLPVYKQVVANLQDLSLQWILPVRYNQSFTSH